VGVGGTLLGWNGTLWTSYTTGPTVTDWYDLDGLWAVSQDDVWASGDGGLILHWNGTSWSQVASGTSSWLGSIWGTAANDLWAVGGNGTIRR